MRHKSSAMTPNDRMAEVICRCQAMVKTFISFGDMSDPLIKMVMKQPSPLDLGDTVAIAMEYLWLYDKAAAAGLVDRDGIDAELLSRFRTTLARLPEHVKKIAFDDKGALKDIYDNIRWVNETYGVPNPTAVSEAAIKKAQGG